MDRSIGPDQFRSGAAHSRGATPLETGGQSRIAQVPIGPASRFEPTVATQPTAHHAAAPTEYENPLSQDQQNFNPIRIPSFAVRAPIADGGSGKPEAGSPVIGSPPAAACDPFVALETASGAVAPTWTHTGARQAEAGFEDPALGWVGVRAQVDTAGIHASLVPGSADAAQTLSSHLPGLNAYLQQHEASVQTLTVAAPQGHSSGIGMDPGAGHSEGQQQGSGRFSGSEAGTEVASSPVRSTRGTGSAQTDGKSEEPSGSLLSGGAYISVFA